MLDFKYSTILKVAVPLMISSFIQSIVLITDSSFLSRYSTDAFAAVGNGGLIYITLYMAFVGMSDGSQILIARRIGQKNTDAIGRIFGTSIITNLILAVVLYMIISVIMPQFLHFYSKHADLADQQIQYINIRGYALFFAMISLAIQAFFMAHGKTTVVLISAAITAISNIVLDYGLIFGKMGFPELGLKGAAWASTIADGTGMLFLILSLLLSVENKRYQIHSHLSFSTQSMKELFKIGSPLMLQGFAALATWTVFFSWIEQIGKFELTVSQNIRSIYFLAFVPIWGFAGTTKTYISQYLGAGKFEDIPKIQKRIQLLSVFFLLLFFHGAMLYPEKLIGLINPDEAFIPKSSSILRFISFSILMYGIFSVYFQTINGSGNTRISFYIEIASVFTYIIGSYLLIKVFKADIFWIWSVEYIYFATTGIISILYLRNSNWKHKII